MNLKQRKNAWIRRSIIVLAAGLALWYVGNIVLGFGRLLADMKYRNITSDSTIDADYGRLFRKDVLANSEYIETIRQPGRNPITLIGTRAHYRIVIYKIDTASNFSLSRLHFENRTTNTWNSNVYNGAFNNAGYHLTYLSRPPKHGTDIYLTIYGLDVENTFLTDSLVTYSCKLTNASLSYEKDGLHDFFLESESDWQPSNSTINIGLVKCDNALYFVIVSSDEASMPVQKDQLKHFLRS